MGIMNITEEMIREIITKVVEKSVAPSGKDDCGFVKKVDPSGIIGIKTSTVKCEPFKQEGVALKDVVTLEEAPRMGAA
jgi:ethanolamine utilization protein EutQ